MKITCLTLSLLLMSAALPAQNKLLTIEDAVLKGRTTLAPERLNQLSWIPGGNEYAYVLREKEDETLVSSKASAKEKKPLVKLSRLNQELKRISPSVKEASKFPSIRWIDPSSFCFSLENRLYVFNTGAQTLAEATPYDKEAENTDIHEGTLSVAFTKKNNLYIALRNGSTQQVTNESNPGIVSGQSVHRNEFGITKGTFWSPGGGMLAFYRMDETMVTGYPLLNIEEKPAVAEKIKYPMAGMKSHQVFVGVYNVQSGKTVFLKTEGPDEHYLTNITWSPDEKIIYIAELNREQNHMKLNSYSVETGSFLSTLFEEKSTRYVEPEHGPLFLKNDPSRFLWFSERDGFNHLYLYDTNGTLHRQLTKGSWTVTDFLGFDKKGEHFYYASTEVSPLERHIYKSNLKTGAAVKLSGTPGMHQAQLNTEGELFIDNVSSILVPRSISIVDSKGKTTASLLEAANPLGEYSMGEVKLFTLKADDNTDLHCRTILPPHFDPTRKYPAFVYLYGGPHAQMVTNSWLGGADLWLHHMAQQGYVVFTLDNRGSAHRGLEFEQATFRKLGTVEVADQLKGIEYLKKQPYIDTTRMGLHGWSFGGFITTSVMTKHPGLFRAAVAGGPVIDWKYYEVMYTERYMDTPQENPEGYEGANLLNYAGNLKGRLMLVHGTSDDVVVWQHSLMFLKKCVDKGVPVDYFVYPGHKHNVTGPDRVHLLKKISEYMDLHVKGAANPGIN
jgi:dipeptidyl-peptidase 4